MLEINPDLRSYTYDELNSVVEELGLPKFRTAQIFKWLHSGVESFDEMTDISKELRNKLSLMYSIYPVSVYRKFVSQIDGTVKFVFELFDGNFVETVVMKYNHGYSICVSSQVGCRMGCEFCQSTKSGLTRNLYPGEILGQILSVQKELAIKISNIVMMGIGEPLDNFDNTVKFLQIVNHPKGINIGYRHISVSTCGLCDKIRQLAEYNFPITLSISLHSVFDSKRTNMMPVNKKYNVDNLLDACRHYQSITGRRISFEYALISGVNDTNDDIKMLTSRLRGIMHHINIIPVNRIENGIYYPPDIKAVDVFCAKLNKSGSNSTVRRTLGSDISASCGQLKSKYDKKRGD